MEPRYEKKFVLGTEHVGGLHSAIRTHPAVFTRSYPNRVVNNIYFDTADLKHYYHHVEGANRRDKVRLRWYGDTQDTVDPILEIKSRVGEIGFKRHYPLSPIYAKDLYGIRHACQLTHQDDLTVVAGHDLRALWAVLYNRYERSYWVSADGRFRLTVDSNLRFSQVSGNGFRVGRTIRGSHEAVLLELKYKRKHHRGAHAVSQYFPWRLVRSSKYVLGVEHLKQLCLF